MLSRTAVSTDRMLCRNGGTPVDENMSPYPMLDEGTEPSPRQSDPTVNRLALYHYQVKSWSDFETKRKRGGGDGTRKEKAYFIRINEYVQDEQYIVFIGYSWSSDSPKH